MDDVGAVETSSEHGQVEATEAPQAPGAEAAAGEPPRPVAPANPDAFPRPVAPLNPAAFRRPVAQTPTAPARGGRPAAGSERSKRTLREKCKALETARERYDASGRDGDWLDVVQALEAAVGFGERAGLLEALPADVAGLARELGKLPELRAPRPPPRPAAPPEARAAALPPAPPPPAAPAAALPPAPPPPAAPPERPLYMGVPAERVAVFGQAAFPLLDGLARRFKTDSFDPTRPVKAVLFRGTPLETKVDGVPVERMAELVGVVAAERWPGTGGSSGPGQAKAELTVLAVAAFGPAAMAAGKTAGSFLVTAGRRLVEKFRARKRLAGGAA